ncbi:O-antigen ligase family protein [Bacillus ndiopicus]|uniref:O-antigen ligase family protein n=1 Tax=Bacillus ndiopicus TaxID=1347368 RepID=UPI0005A6B7FE|nr:O-antigen ligase family protein [Bacillus ndiopicus]
MEKKRYKSLFVYFVAYYTLLLFTSKIIPLFTLINLIFILHFSAIFFKMTSRQVLPTMILLLIISTPLSFTSILGLPYGQLPISWFNLSILLIILYVLARGLVKRNIVFNSVSTISLLILLYLLVPMLNSSNVIEGVKQVLNYYLFFLVIIIWPNIKLGITEIKASKRVYIASVVAVACVVILQAGLFRLGFSTGNTLLLGGNRFATGYLFSDYSFLSLYLLTPVFFIYFEKMRVVLKIPLLLLLAIASFMTTARTGITALGICIILFLFVYTLKNIIKRTPLIVVFWSGLITIGSVILFLVGKVRSGDLLSGSGRMEGYTIAISEWLKSPLLGIGFDMRTYKENVGTAMPHNIVIQTLLQGGIVYLFLFVILFLIIYLSIYKVNKHEIWGFILVILGAQFIPDILDSRFFLVIILLLLIKNKENVSQNNRKSLSL